MSDIRVPVLIVGGGGAGLTMSTFLSSHGIDHLLVERHEGTSLLPKASYLNQRTMEVLRQHGVAESVYAVGAPVKNISKETWATSLAGDGPLDAKTFYEMDSFGGGAMTERYERDSACPSTNYPQMWLEPLLRNQAEERAPGKILFHHELTEMVQDGEGVTATILNRSTGETFTVEADYLVGADGGKTVGQMIGATMIGPSELIDIVSTHFTADLSPWWDDDVLMVQLISPRAGSYPSGGTILKSGPTWDKHSENWVIHFTFLPNDPATFDEQTIVPKIRELLGVGELDIEVKTISSWAVQGALVDKYQEGRVFLVGDAAHRHPPTTGLGLNTSIQDSHNLAWKLAAVIKGQADATLLDTYGPERQPVGMRVVDWAMFTLQNHFLIDAGIGMMPIPLPPEMFESVFSTFFSDTAIGETRRARFEEAISTHRVEFQAHDIEIGFSYQSGALVPDGSTPPPTDPMGVIYQPTTRPGHRLPHAWLETSGSRLSTHDLTGSDGRFVLITGSDGAVWAAAAAQTAAKFGVEITVAAIGSDYTDVDGQWAQVREIGDAGAILVRPDNHVAWRSMSSGPDVADALVHAIGTVLQR